MDFSDRWVQALITAVAGVLIVTALRFVLGAAFDRYLKRASGRRPSDEVARLRTRLVVLRRVILAFVVVIVCWSILEVFPATEELGRTLLASGALLAVFVGVAFSVPLGNVGAGILIALSQPVRLGDRVSVGDVTGTTEEITLIYTVLRSDEGHVVFIPNSQMVSSVVVNRSLQDPRRAVTVRLPIAVTAPVDRARTALLEAAQGLEPPLRDVRITLAEVGEKTAWLSLTAYAPQGAESEELAATMREHGLAALAGEALLPS